MTNEEAIAVMCSVSSTDIEAMDLGLLSPAQVDPFKTIV